MFRTLKTRFKLKWDSLTTTQKLTLRYCLISIVTILLSATPKALAAAA